MSHFIEVAFGPAMKLFEDAEKDGIRWRIGDFTTSKWLQKNNVNFDDIV